MCKEGLESPIVDGGDVAVSLVEVGLGNCPVMYDDFQYSSSLSGIGLFFVYDRKAFFAGDSIPVFSCDVFNLGPVGGFFVARVACNHTVLVKIV